MDEGSNFFASLPTHYFLIIITIIIAIIIIITIRVDMNWNLIVEFDNHYSTILTSYCCFVFVSPYLDQQNIERDLSKVSKGRIYIFSWTTHSDT